MCNHTPTSFVLTHDKRHNSLKKNTNALPDASKEVVHKQAQKNLDVSGENHNIRTANRSFGNVSKLKYSRTTVTFKDLIREEIKTTLHSGNACYH
jgi:hypothetical protein